MQAMQKRLILWLVLVSAIAVGLVFAFMPRPLPVDLTIVEETSMTVTADAEGKTRVHDVFLLSAPVGGYMRRIDLHAGDPVVANETVLARIEPADSAFLDPRSESQARAMVNAARAARELATAEVQRAQAELVYAQSEHQRARRLFIDRTFTQHEVDATERAYKSAVAVLATAKAALQVKTFQLEQAQATLLSPSGRLQSTSDCACIEVFAPVSGTVLRVHNPSARVVATAEPLLEIGDPRDLEIVSDYLSTDAVNIASGQSVFISNWGQENDLLGLVRRVEPFGFTKVSALGIEEQRVNVVVDLVSSQDDWATLGHGYQVDTRIVLWHSDNVLTVPLTALFRRDKEWVLFVSDDGRARLTQVEVGHTNGRVAEILSGIEPGAQVVLHPSDRITEGARIAARGTASDPL